MIVDIGRWVIETACRQAVALDGEAPLPTISVNLSVRQLRDPNLAGDLATSLAATGLAPERLLLEITESVVMDDVDTSLRALAALKALGVRLAIDDFGTGYSSLSYLRQLPVDTVKIDRSFVAELDEGMVGHTLAGAVVSVCRMFGLSTTAEGVEEPGQVAALRAVGCDEAQGYLFARPVPADELALLLATFAADRRLTAGFELAQPNQAA
jgi:EAL domain-containing protein (putative c-di-GMP-specific phosphodiesterase class I)